jgi:hypothetical protein
LPFEEERAFSEMLDGFHRLLRYFHESFSPPRRPEPPEDGEDQ